MWKGKLQIGSDERSDPGRHSLNLLEQLLVRVAGWKPEEVGTATFDPFGGQPPELATERGDVPVAHLLGQAQALEGAHEIVGPEHQFQVGRVGPEASGGNRRQMVGVLELSPEEFLCRSVAVAAPDRLGGQGEIGDQGAMVDVALEGKQMLLGFRRFVGDGSAHRDEPMFLLPVEGGVGELGRFPAFAEGVIPSRDHPVLEGLGHLGDNHVADPCPVEGLGDVLVVEGPIEAQAGARGRNRPGQLVQLRDQEWPGTRARRDIAGSQFRAQRQSCPAFAGEDRGVGAVAMTPLRDVAPGHPFLVAIRDEGGGVGIHDGIVTQPQTLEQIGADTVVGGFQAGQVPWGEAPQERPERIAVRKVRQAQEWRNESVVEKRLGVLDPPDPRYNRDEVRQTQVHGMVGPRVIGRPIDMGLKEAPHPQRVAKQVEQAQTTKAGQAWLPDDKSELPQAFGHGAQVYHLGRFVQRPLYRRCQRSS